jgi:hypothetical protein
LATKELAVALRESTFSHFLFHQGFCLPKTKRLSSHTHTTLLFHRLKMKLKGRHFDTTEVIEAESQSVPNTLTEHDFHDAFKYCRRAGNGAYV